MRSSFSWVAALGLLSGCAGAPEDAAGRASASVIVGAELQLDMLGPGAVPPGARGSYQVVVSNLGSALAQSVVVNVALPTGAAFVSGSTGCALVTPQLLRCALGTVGAQRAVPRAFTLTHPSAGAVTVTSAVTTPTPETDYLNNDGTADTAIGAPGAVPLALATPQDMAATACFGSAVNAFAQCSPSSLVAAPFTLLANQTIRTTGSVTGVWSQPSGATSLRVEFVNAQGATTMIYNGTATSSRCVEGLSYNASMVKVGAFRACSQ